MARYSEQGRIFANIITDKNRLKSQIAGKDTNTLIGKRNNAFLIIRNVTSRVRKASKGHAWIVGSSTNGIVGPNTNTGDGLQQTVGGGGRVYEYIVVVNKNDVWNEIFDSERFKESATAYWDTTNLRLAMDSGTGGTYDSNAITEIIYRDNDTTTVTRVKIGVTETIAGSDTITYFASANNGIINSEDGTLVIDDIGNNVGFSTWEQITNLNVWQSLSTTGNDLRVKINFDGTGGSSTYIEDLNVEYEYV